MTPSRASRCGSLARVACLARGLIAPTSTWAKEAIGRIPPGGVARFVTLALYALLEWRRAELRRGFWLSMSRSHKPSIMTATAPAAYGLPIADAQGGGASARADSPFQFLSITTTDAARGLFDWPRPSTRPRTWRERVSHAKQNDHRCVPPRRNQGGSPTR